MEKNEQEKSQEMFDAIITGMREWRACHPKVTLTRFGRVKEEKSGLLSKRRDHEQTTNQLYESIQARSSPARRNQ